MNTCTIVYQPPYGAKGLSVVLPNGSVHSIGSAPQPVDGSYTRSSAEKAVILWAGTHSAREPSRSCGASFTTRRGLPLHKEKVPSTATIAPKDSVSQQNSSSTTGRDLTLHQSSSIHSSSKGGSHPSHHHHHHHSAKSRVADSHSSRPRHTIPHASSIKPSDVGVKHAGNREKSKYPPAHIHHHARGSEQVMVNVTRWAPMSIFGPVKKSSRDYGSIRSTDLFPVETATFIGSSSGVAQAHRRSECSHLSSFLLETNIYMKCINTVIEATLRSRIYMVFVVKCKFEV